MTTSRPIIKTPSSNWKAFKREFDNFEEFLAEFESLSQNFSGPALRGALILNLFDLNDLVAACYISKQLRQKFNFEEHKTVKTQVINQFTEYEIKKWNKYSSLPIDNLIYITTDTCLSSIKYFFTDVEVVSNTIMTSSYYQWMKIRKWLARDSIKFSVSAEELKYSITIEDLYVGEDKGSC
jgi:hypothetical protein